MAELFDTTTYQVQRVGSALRHRDRGFVYLDETGLTILESWRQRVFVNLAPGKIQRAELVTTLTGKMSIYRPPRKSVLRLEATTAQGRTVIGVVVLTERADEWVEAAKGLEAVT